MKKSINIKKIAFLLILVLTMFAVSFCVAADETEPVGESDNGAAVVQVEEDLPDFTDSEVAADYLDNYTTNSSEDPGFEENSKAALATMRETTPFYATFFALVPPIVAIVLALITKEVYSSLFIGIVIGGLLSANFSVTSAMDNLIEKGFISAVADTAGIFIFLVLLGVMVALINKSGASATFGKWAAKHIKSRVGASLATFVLGILIFIDDYFNCLTVGSVMLPVTDANKISRAKLAFLIDATAAPVCMIAPISSWAAAVSSYAEEGQGLKLFIEAIPYNFYSLLTFVFIITITLMKFDYGPMRKHEINAQNGDLFTNGAVKTEENNTVTNTRGKVIDIIIPTVILIIVCVVALVYNGNGNSFSGMNVIDAFSNTDATVGLPLGAMIAIVVCIVYFIIRRIVSFKGAMDAIPEGFKAMVPAILILTMATALKNMTGLLGAKVFVAQLMEGAAAGLSNLLPAIIFVVACVLAFATGTSWGTFGILIPIVTAIFPDNHTLMIIGMSACLAGAVCGDHCSPISDTTIMSSAGAQCDHINHVSTQLPYSLTVAAVSFVNFLIAPYINNALISLAIAIAMMIGVLFVLKVIFKNKQTA